MKKNRNNTIILLFTTFFTLSLSSCNDEVEQVFELQQHQNVIENMEGEWVGAKIEIYDIAQDILYDEKAIRGEIFGDYPPYVKDDFISFYRNKSSYKLEKDGHIIFTTLKNPELETSETISIEGIIYPTNEDDGSYAVVLDTKSTGLPNLENYKRQRIIYNGFYLIVQRYEDMLGFDLITYYKPAWAQ